MRKKYILILLLCILPFFMMCSDSDSGTPTVPDPDPNPEPEITEYILSAKVTNKEGSAIEIDNKAKTLLVKIPRYYSKNNVKIALTLNKGVSMEFPKELEAEYNLLGSNTKIWLKANNKTVIFEMKYEDIVGEDSAIGKADIRDMVLIYDGGDHRTVVWDEKMFEPYVSIESDDPSKRRWLFDGFLYLEIFSTTHQFASGYGRAPARKTEWIGLMDTYLTEGKSMMALDATIEKVKGKAPDHGKRKIVISLPEPIPNQKDWGQLNGKAMDFSIQQDRIDAVEWYIDYLIEEFAKAEFKNLQLAGFYWVAETASDTRTILSHVSNYIKEKDLRFYWIPYLGANGAGEWASLGFDKAYQQPNYFFSQETPEWIMENACEFAKQHNMDMEFEFDGRATTAGGGWSDRFMKYVEAFTRHGVFENKDVAYYEGGNGMYLLKNGSAEDLELYKILTEIIADRQEKKYGK